MVAAVGVVLVGCGQAPDPPPAAQSESARAHGPGLTTGEIHRQDGNTAWTNGYCEAVGELVESVSTMPDIDPSTPQRASRTSSDVLGVMVSGLDRTLDRLNALQPAPSQAAENVRARAVTTYAGIRSSARDAQRRLDAATTSQDSRTALGAARVPLERIGQVNLLDGFEDVPELAQASLRAPACLELTHKSAQPRFDGGTG